MEGESPTCPGAAPNRALPKPYVVRSTALAAVAVSRATTRTAQPTAIQQDEDDQKLRAFFTSGTARDAAARSLASAFGNHLFTEPIEIDDDDWAARSQAGLQPVTVGRITVVPGIGVREPFSLDRREKGSRTPISIVIRPSMGFGTGHHATTRLMLWTNDVLRAARHLYEEFGFELISEEVNELFGQPTMAQTWGRGL